MKIILVRHGQSQFNKLTKENKKIYSGQYDCELSEEGKRAAVELRNNSYIKSIEQVYSSDLKRAFETAKLATQKENIILDKRLRERSLGVFEGKFARDLQKDYPEYVEDGRYRNFTNDFIVKAPNGENYTDVIKRAMDFFNSINLKDNCTIGIFFHGRFLSYFISVLMNLEEEKTLNLEIPNSMLIAIIGKEIGHFIMESHSINELLNLKINKK